MAVPAVLKLQKLASIVDVYADENDFSIAHVVADSRKLRFGNLLLSSFADKGRGRPMRRPEPLFKA